MYGDVSGVNALIPGVGTIDQASVPTDTEVEGWLAEASAMVDSALAGAGYSIGIDTSAAIYPVLEAMTQLYAAATVLQAQGIDTNSGAEENRSEKMFARFYKWLGLINGSYLEALGVPIAATPPRSRRRRTTQLRRVDGYSGTYEGSTMQYSYASE